jgi:energy-converting hydrogenase Eha subunit H
MQNSFSSGELSASLYGRVDLDKYHTGLQTCRNAFVDYRGGITRRPGTRMVGATIEPTTRPRLIPFTYSSLQAYVLVFGTGTMRVIRNGGFVTEPAIAMTRSGTTYTATAHGLTTGDSIVVSDIVPWLKATVIDANNFTLTDVYTNTLVSSNATTFARIFTLSTPYAAADLPLLKYTQSFDTMTLTHPFYVAKNLTRSQHWVWTLSTVVLGTSIVPPSSITSLTGYVTGTIPPGSGLTTAYGYVITSVDADGQESGPCTEVDIFYYNRDALAVTIRIAWATVSAAARYNVYAAIPSNGIGLGSFPSFGYIGTTRDTEFTDTNITADFTKVPPTGVNPFSGGNNPGVSTYFDQRKVYAASVSNPQTLYMSKPGEYNNFDVSQPANDGDALTLTLSTVQSSQIRALLPMPDGMLVFTQSGVFKVSGGGTNVGIKVSNSLARQQNYIGINDIQPIPVNFEILFVQEKGAIVRALTYNFYTSTYEPADLTLLSNHLFTGRTVVEWAYAEHPSKIIWCIRDDGQLLALTYLKDQKIQGWTRHDTNGLVESVASISELGTDGVYFAVRRQINGVWYRFIEELQSTDITKGVEYAWYLDAALDYGSIFPAAALSFSGVSGTVVAGTGSVTGIFASGDVGKIIRAAGGMGVITVFGNTSQVTMTWLRNPTDIVQPGPQTTSSAQVREQPAGTWTMAAKVTSLSGLNHLINTQVSYLADGVPGTGTVSATGTLTIGTASSKVIVGLGYRTQCQTLDLEPSGNSLQGKHKRVIAVTAKVQNTGVMQWGPTFNELTPWIDVYGDRLTNLVMTGDQPLGVNQFYDYGGRVCWQQDLPLPMTVLSLVPELSPGD